jgi:hypothetical protein
METEKGSMKNMIGVKQDDVMAAVLFELVMHVMANGDGNCDARI